MRLDDAALAARLADTDVFCRVQPEQKLRLVQAFRARGEVVAMTGDGVNDAPALKAAHIGVAMGARGTDVAREAAALVLLNDDFASLVTAVRYGRRVFANLRKAIAFVVAVHLPIVGLSDRAGAARLADGADAGAHPVPAAGHRPGLLDRLRGRAAGGRGDAGAASASRAHGCSTRQVLWRGLVQGSGLLVIVLVAYALRALGRQAPMRSARALAFSVLVLSNLALIHANRPWARQAGARRPRWNAAFGWIAVITCGLLVAILAIPAVGGLFAFATPTPHLLVVGVGLGLLALGWFEAVKWFDARRTRPHA